MRGTQTAMIPQGAAQGLPRYRYLVQERLERAHWRKVIEKYAARFYDLLSQFLPRTGIRPQPHGLAYIVVE